MRSFVSGFAGRAQDDPVVLVIVEKALRVELIISG